MSEEALAEYKVNFMEKLFQPDRLPTRVRLWAEEKVRPGNLPSRSGQTPEAVGYRGQLSRSECPDLLGVAPRHGHRLVSPMIDSDVLGATGTGAP